MQNIKGIIEIIFKLPISFLLFFSFSLSFLVLSPDHLLDRLALMEFSKTYRMFLGPALLVIACLLFSRLCTGAINFLYQRQASSKRLKLQRTRLENLTPEEKGYLVPFISGEKTSIYVGLDDGILNELRSKGIVYISSRTGSALDGFPVNLHSWSRDILTKNPSLLDGAVGRPLTPRQRRNIRWGRR